MTPTRTPPSGTPLDWSAVDIAVPHPSARLPGISMAGFRPRDAAPVDIAMVAHPCVTLLVEVSGGGEGGLVHDSRGRTVRGSVVVGLLPGDLRATGSQTGEYLQIRLEPVVAAGLLGGAAEFSGAVVPLVEVWGREAERVEERLRRAGSWDERFARAADALGRRLDARRPDPEVAHTWRRTLMSRGRVRVDGLANEVGWSRKRLTARFRGQLGIAPKRAARLVRFDHAARLLAAGHTAARAAAESGYVDQSHLHREVVAFAGLTPSGVAAAPWLAIDEIAWPDSSPSRPPLAAPTTR